MFYYLNCFFVYSFLGFLLESIVYFALGSSGGSGIFYGPWTPVYGIGAITIILVSEWIFQKRKGNRLLKTILLFLIVSVLLSVLEYIGGILIEWIFHIVFWDYSNHKYHLGRYVALDMSLIWGGMSIFFLYCIKPWMDKVIKKIPYWITCTLITCFVIDIICTFIFRLH